MSRVRYSIQQLEKWHQEGNEEPLEKLILAWKGIQDLPHTDPNSFYLIAGYHGQPFRGAGWGNPAWWGGYCHHGNVLFPTWHRAYLLRLEEALRTIVPDVTLSFWDETEISEGSPLVPTT